MTIKPLVLAAALFASSAVSAATLVSAPASTGEIGSPGSTAVSFAAAAGPGAASFVIQGFRSLDGVNCCTDTFTLNLNGTDIFSGSFDLGGGGVNTVYIAGGATLSQVNFGFYVGGELSVALPLALIAGTNTLTFSYAGVDQSIPDEAWGIRALTVTGATVPEPASWALLVGGFAMVGLAARRRSKIATA